MAEAPSLDMWLKEAKADESSRQCGMYLFHNGTVRSTAKAKVRFGENEDRPVSGMEFSYDEKKTEEAVSTARKLEGIYYVRVWMNSGTLAAGESIMLVLIGGDTRPHVVRALDMLVDELKNNCVTEKEIF